MILTLSAPVLISLSVILILAFVGYTFIYPLKIIALFSFFFKKKKSQNKDILALPLKPRIRISFDRSIKDDSNLIIELKKFLRKLAKENSNVYLSENHGAHDSPSSGDQLDIPYIPGEDEDFKDPEIKIESFPETSEKDTPAEDSDYIYLKDL
jgi:hypothetical protein